MVVTLCMQMLDLNIFTHIDQLSFFPYVSLKSGF
jgi:hypothetical protein